MSNPSTYWTLVKINVAGNRQIQSIPAAQTFFHQVFADLIKVNNLANGEIQSRLFNFYGDTNTDKSLNAHRCLLCFISWEIERVCLNLAKQFGAMGGFTSRDLLPYVLDDDGKLHSTTDYQCYSLQILQSFDVGQSSLASWTNRRVKQHPALNKFLLECGVYLLSDWAILNDTQPKQLERILSQFHSLSGIEIQQSKWLLTSYHAVYRVQRLQQRKAKTSKCQPPTIEQLQQIGDKLNSLSGGNTSCSDIITGLQQLAQAVREYRIHIRGGSLPTTSIDTAEGINYNSLASNNVVDDDSENQTGEFLKLYRPQFLECLDNALATVTQTRVSKIRRKDVVKANKFLIALKFFHCQGLSMGEIAKRIEMKAQFQVTRLLKLKEFRADVTHELLLMLKSRVLELARNYSSVESLQVLESQINTALTEQVSSLIAEAEAEASSSRSEFHKSRFAKRLCEYLDSEKVMSSE